MSKTCTICGINKSLEYFYKEKRAKDGHTSACKRCILFRQSEYRKKNKLKISIKQKKYRNANKEKLKEYKKSYYEKNRSSIREKHSKYYKNNSSKIKEKVKEYVENNREKVAKCHKRYYTLNKDAISERNKRWRREHKEQLLAYRKKYREIPSNRARRSEYIKKRKATDPVFHLSQRVRSLTCWAFRNGGYPKRTKTEQLLGCDFNKLHEHLVSTWEKNYGTKWNGEEYHIDHIVPLATAKTEEDVIRLCHYTNLQMLTPKDNMLKSDKIFFMIN